MATERIRYVDTDAAGAGNGTSWENAYASLSAMEDAEDGDLVSADVWLHVYCRALNGTADTTPVTFQSSTLDLTRYILIEAAAGYRAHLSGWDTACYRISVANAFALTVSDDYVFFDGIQAEVTGTNGNYQSPITISGVPATNNYTRITNCRLRLATGTGFTSYAIYGGDSDSIVRVWNTILEVGAGNAGTVHGCNAGGATFELYNCLSYGFSRGLSDAGGGLAKAYDCVSLNNTDDFYGTWNTKDYCASDDGDGTNAVTETGGGADWTGDFTDGSAGNWTLLTGSGLKGAGGAAGSGLFSTDMDGNTRTDWSVGPAEYVASGTAHVKIINE